jgi:hypothetical protein
MGRSCQATSAHNTYWTFACARQDVFFKKVADERPPWTRDPILLKYRFTNAYRAADRVSQYLIRNVIYSGEQSPKEVFFRTILFRLFNRIETWELLRSRLGTICWREYLFACYNSILTEALEAGRKIFTAAYIMPSGNQSFGHSRKHANCLNLLEAMMRDDLPQRICDARSMEQVFLVLRSYPMLGDFLAYQYTIDINYSNFTSFSEMEFVVPGPGAKAGIKKCFNSLGSMSESDIIRWVAENQESEFERRNLEFKTLWGRPLQLVDCQNLFCELDKYARIAHPSVEGGNQRKRIKQKYHANPTKVSYWFPPKWGLNERMRQQVIPSDGRGNLEACGQGPAE